MISNTIIRRRSVILSIIAIIIFLLYSIRLFSIQILYNSRYRDQAQRARQQSEIVIAQRGKIYDRHYDDPLVTNVLTFAIEAIPSKIPKNGIDNLLNNISDVIDVPDGLTIPTNSNMRSIEIAENISLDQIAYLSEKISEYPGIYWRVKSRRNYTQSASMSHILGYVGDITSRELQVLFNQGYNFNSIVGKQGIEKQYDKLLKGTDGLNIQAESIDSISSSSNNYIAPLQGNNLILTIDRYIQSLVVQALGARVGAVVVLKPSTGEILALASYPTYDANLFYGADRSSAYREISLLSNAPFINRAISSTYAPASTFKIVMSAAVMEEQVFGIKQTVNAKGYYQVGNRIFYDWDRSGFGHINIFEGLAQSSNVFFWTMGVEYLGAETIAIYSHKFGFGSESGIDLPSEIPGIVPTPSWKRRVHSEAWLDGDTANFSIGQGFLTVTPLQIANMLALIVNDGIIYKPYLLKEVRDQVTKEILQQTVPKVLLQTDMVPSTYENIRKGLRDVIINGTAAPVITTRAVKIAGKTGTGQVSGEEGYHSWFVAYAPYDSIHPEEQVVISILVDATNEWEWWAPKAANIILHGIFTNQNFNDSVDSLRKSTPPLWYL